MSKTNYETNSPYCGVANKSGVLVFIIALVCLGVFFLFPCILTALLCAMIGAYATFNYRPIFYDCSAGCIATNAIIRTCYIFLFLGGLFAGIIVVVGF